jgi:hypothetical protein
MGTCKHLDIVLRPDGSCEQYYYRHGIHTMWKRRVTGPNVSRRITVLSPQKPKVVSDDLVIIPVNGEDAVHYRLSDAMIYDAQTRLWHFAFSIPIRLSQGEIYYLQFQGRDKQLSAMHRKCSTKFVSHSGNVEYFSPRDAENLQLSESGILYINWFLEDVGSSARRYR